MQTEPLTAGVLLVRTIAVARQKAFALLGWGLVAILLCLPCAMIFAQQVGLVASGKQIDLVSLWSSFTPLEKLGTLFSIWFMTLGLLGLTQAVSALATWDACTQTPTSLRSLTTRLLPKLHRIMGLQLFVILMLIVLLPLSVFAIPAILIDNCGVFKGFGKSASMWSHHAGKTILILFFALVVAVGWRLTVGATATPEGLNPLLVALAFEARLLMFYFAGVVVGIPTTLLYYQSRETLQSPTQH